MIRKRFAITIFAAAVFAAGCSSSDDDSSLPSDDGIVGIDAPAPVPDDSDGSVNSSDEPDGSGTVPVVPGDDTADPLDVPGDDVSETPTSGPGDDDAPTVDGVPVEPSDDDAPGNEDSDDDALPPPPPGADESEESDDDTDVDGADDQPLTTVLVGLDSNPEESRALITRQILETTEFGAQLDAGDQPFTMFVPTDAAFINLGMSLEQLLDDPELANTVRFHIVEGEALDRAMLDARSGQNLMMSNGQSNPLSQNGESLQIGSATISDAPGGGTVRNGVFYLIDQVLIPASGE